MFCPLCKAEYREGLTTCPDCEAALLPSSPPVERDAAAAKGPLVPLWEGDDLRLHASLLEALDAAKIPYLNKPLSVFPGVRRADPFPVQPLTQFGYKVAVLSSDFFDAKQILDRLQMEQPKLIELPEQSEEGPITSEPRIGSRPRTKHDEDRSDEEPTVEVWRGRDEEFARFLQDALRENAMPLRTETSADEAIVYVRPSDALRAREIVRELKEASPSQ
jgi:hypothetical protein